jgi:arylsulfatase A-like enzyme
MLRVLLFLAFCPLLSAETQRPNVLFISVDDLNDWIGCLSGHPLTKTPHIDALAKSGVLFTNAHCAAPSCNPSRAAIFTGIPPHRSGLYHNGQVMRDVLPHAELIPKCFSRQGYWSAGAGKLLHYKIDPQSWDDYFPAKQKDNPLPETHYPKKRPVNLPLGGPWQYEETDWAALDISDEDFGGDHAVTQWISDQLRRKHDKPFFLACGIYRPHEPWFVPKDYFAPFPLDQIKPGPGYKAGDLDDIPPTGQKIARNRYFEHIQKHDQWMHAIQAYLASIHFADAMVGRVIAALDKSPHRDNTIVVLWSDHGWHLGEKEHWQKFTGWRLGTRVPLIIRVPGGKQNIICDAPISLVDLYRTLTDLCQLTPPTEVSPHSLAPLLEDPQAAWPHAAITQLSDPAEYAISARSTRYIHYRNGDEELYDIASDPHEWHNLAKDPAHAAQLAELRAFAPKDALPVPAVPLASLPELPWHPGDTAPPSKPDGNTFDVVFLNQRSAPIEICWMPPQGPPKHYGLINPDAQKRQQTRPGAVWLIRDTNQKSLGYFIIGDRTSKAIVTAP